MNNSPTDVNRYPLLEALLADKGLKLKGIYTIQDAAEIFGSKVRTIQEWVHDGKLVVRDLPSGGRFLSQDLERSLQESVRRRKDPMELPTPVLKQVPKRLRVPTKK